MAREFLSMYTTQKTRDERNITSMEMWCWPRLKRISWMEKRIDDTILKEVGELLCELL